MTLANPIALLWGLLAVPVVLLYMRRLRAHSATVAAGTIWQQVLAEESRRSAWQPYRHRVSLAVQLTALGLLVLAAADPQVTPRRLVIIIDNSAAMNLAHEKATRLDEAQQAAKHLIADIGPLDSVGLVSMAKTSAVRCNPTNEMITLQKAIDAIPPGRGAADVTAAVELARRIFGEDSPGRIVVLSSCSFPGAAKSDKAEDVELFRIGKSAANAAITRLNVRREPVEGGPCQVLVEVANFSDKRANTRLSILLDGKSLQEVSLQIPADGRRKHVFQIGPVESGELVARIESSDVYMADNSVSASLPPLMGRMSLFDIEQLATASNDFRVPELGAEATLIEARQRGAAPWVYLAVLGIILLAAEWCLYQRRWLS